MESFETGRYEYELTTGILRLNDGAFTGATTTEVGNFISVNARESAY